MIDLTPALIQKLTETTEAGGTVEHELSRSRLDGSLQEVLIFKDARGIEIERQRVALDEPGLTASIQTHRQVLLDHIAALDAELIKIADAPSESPLVAVGG